MRALLAAAAVVLWTSMAGAQPAGVIEAPLGKAWQATPEWCPGQAAREYGSVVEPGRTGFDATGGKGVMIWTSHPTPKLDVSGMRYLTMRYRARGLDPSLPSYLLYLSDGDDGAMYARNLAVGAADLIHDGQWHTFTTQLHPYGQIGAMALRFRALPDQVAHFDLEYLRFTAEPPRRPLSEMMRWQTEADGVGEISISIDAQCNEDLPALQRALDLADWFDSERVVADGVSFWVPTKGVLAIATGVKERQKVTVPVDSAGAALYLLMGAQFPYKMLGYAGWEPGDVTERPQQFRVTVHYADGGTTEYVPYCLSQGAYGAWRGLRTYCVPLERGRTVQEFELWDGMPSSAFHLVGATISEVTSLAPPVAEAPVVTPAGKGPSKTAPGVVRKGQMLLARGPWGEVAFDLTRSLAIARVSNAAHPDWGLKITKAVPLFQVTEGDTTYGGEAFTVHGTPAISERLARVPLISRAARLTGWVTIEATAAEVRLSLSLNNQGPARALEVTFPQVALSHARSADAAYFYPTSSPVWSSADGAYDTAYSGSFPVQFETIYDRARGGGLYLATRATSLQQRYFQLSKAGGALRMAVAYRDQPVLGVGQTMEFAQAALAPHGGDWRPAWNSYLAWLRGWYQPARPRLAWYQHVWNFRTWWTHTMAAEPKADYNLLNAATGAYQTSRFIARDREQYGQVDMVHFFDWRISSQHGEFGDYSHYEDLGGLPPFRGMIGDLQLQHESIRVGLYLDCYLVSRKSDIGRQHGEEWALHDQSGAVGRAYSTPEDPKWSMCVNETGWQDYLSSAAARVAAETGCDGIYLDEGMSDMPGYWCWRADHGHPVPAWNQPGLLELVKKTRAKLPEGVALYTEWSPPDAMTPYLDGAYQANLGHCDLHRSPGFLQLARFAFPDFRVFTISNAGGMSEGIWEGLQYSLFSGVPLYTLSWGHEPEASELVRKISAILHDYQEAFLTTTPKPFIPTTRAGVYCNEFPARTQTVWTFWNERYQTLTGPVLRVKHAPGRYVDVWNGKDLSPVATKDGFDLLTTTLGPRGVGAIARVTTAE